MVNAPPAPLSGRLSLMMACAVAGIVGTFSTLITRPSGRLTVRMPDTAASAVSILPATTRRERSWVLGLMPGIRFNEATPFIGRGVADAALFRESVERMDRP
jgi:hypothetical protein